MKPVCDVVVPVYRDLALTRACLESVLELSGESLGRLYVVDDASPEPGMASALSALRLEDPRVRVLTNPRNQGFVASANLGLAASQADVVVLNSDARVTPGWLEELHGALVGEPRYAALSPLSNNATMCSVPDFGAAVPVEALDAPALGLAALPRTTELPTAHGFCLLLRRTALRELGLFDPAYGRGYNEENDWCQRARAAGYLVGRANRAFVYHHGEVSFQGARARLDVLNARRLIARYPRYLQDNRAFEQSAEARVAARFVRARLGRLSVNLAPGLAALAPLVESWFQLVAPDELADVWAGGPALDPRGISVPFERRGTPARDAQALQAAVLAAVGVVPVSRTSRGRASAARGSPSRAGRPGGRRGGR